MFSKRKLLIVSAMLIVMLLVSGMLGAKDKVLRISNSGPADPTDRTVIANDIFKRIVEQRTGGEIKVQVFHASQLGNERESYEGIMLGIIDMGTLTTGPLPGFFEDIMVLDIPYLFKTNALAWKVMDGSFGQEISNELRKKTGIRALAWTDHGFRHFTNKVRPISSPADMKGLKIRTMENPAHMKMVEALGAAPTPLGFNDLYMALQQGVVDGQENPITLMRNMKFYEVQDYLVVDGHVYNYLGLFINDKKFNSFSKEEQDIIMDAAEVWKAVHAGYTQVQVQRGYEELEKAGMKITFLSASQKEAFRKATQDHVIDYVESKIGRKWIDKLLLAIDAAEAELYKK